MRTAWEAEVTVSRDQTTALQPGQQSKILSQKKKKKSAREIQRRKDNPGLNQGLLQSLAEKMLSMKKKLKEIRQAGNQPMGKFQKGKSRWALKKVKKAGHSGSHL